MTHIEHDHLLDSLDFVSRDARHLVIDAVYCAIFNAAGDLEGNTEKSDVEWFARQIWQDVSGRVPGRWEGMTDDNKEFWRKVAKASLERLPYLMGRIAHRCRMYTQAINSLLKAERKAAQRD